MTATIIDHDEPHCHNCGHPESVHEAGGVARWIAERGACDVCDCAVLEGPHG